MKKIMFNDRLGLTGAVLEGKKTVTRRVVKIDSGFEVLRNYGSHLIERNSTTLVKGKILPPYKVGEVVAVAQSYLLLYDERADDYVGYENGAGWTNKACVKAELMPHQVRILSVTAERLQDITYKDCCKEGFGTFAPDPKDFPVYPTPFVASILLEDAPRDTYAALIDKIHGKGTWKSNPWVWRIEFELIK